MIEFRTALAGIGLLVGVSAWQAGCAHPQRPGVSEAGAPPAAPAAVNHVVFFKLKDGADADALIADSRGMLGSIPGVISLFAGKHLETGRSVVRSDYDACVYVGFATLDDYAGYLAHPNHTALVAEWKDRFEWYHVYDVADATFDAPGGHGR